METIPTSFPPSMTTVLAYPRPRKPQIARDFSALRARQTLEGSGRGSVLVGGRGSRRFATGWCLWDPRRESERRTDHGRALHRRVGCHLASAMRNSPDASVRRIDVGHLDPPSPRRLGASSSRNRACRALIHGPSRTRAGLKAADTRLGSMLTAWILLSTQWGSAHRGMSCGSIAIGALELREADQAWATEGAAPTYSSPYWKRSAFGYTGSAATSLPESYIPRSGVLIHF
jgi:hypothetical protein